MPGSLFRIDHGSVTFDGMKELEFVYEDIHRLSSYASGGFDYMNTNVKQHQDFYNTTVDFTSDQKVTVTGKYDEENRKSGSIHLKMSGSVNSLSLGGIDLRPSILSWLRNNAYTLPISIAAVIFSAVNLVKAGKNEKDNGGDTEESKNTQKTE